MPWQIQVRRKHDGREWEPISVERCRIVPGWIDGPAHERQYHYESLDEVKLAFAEYVEVEGGLPNLLVRMATGRLKFTDKYDVRFVWISQPGIVWTRETLPATALPTKDSEDLGSTPRPPSGEQERGRWRVGSKVNLNVYDGDRPVCQCHSWLDSLAIVVAMNRYIRKEPAAAPPEAATATSAPPNTEQVFYTPDRRPGEKGYWPEIGGHDYPSWVSCLRTNYKKVFGDDAPLTDPQDMIQRMAAEIQELRRGPGVRNND